MKTAVLLLASAFALGAHATVYTVSNEPGYPAQYTNLQAAHDAAAGGDTLYVTPSATSYGDLMVDRAITVLGGGYGDAVVPTLVSNIYCVEGSAGSGFVGFDGYVLYLDYYVANSNLLVDRCRFSQIISFGYGFDGLVLKHSVVGPVTLSACTNVLITNNLITGPITGSISPSVLISNNIFSGDSYGYALNNIQYAVVSNNIFVGSAPGPDGYGVAHCAFNNNLSYQTSDDDLPATGNNVGAGNLIGVDPRFVSVPDLQGLPAYDYHLKAASPGHNAGTDGTDIGLYGGSAPLTGNLDGVPRLPLVTQFNLLNSSIGQGGSINVQVQGSKHD